MPALKCGIEINYSIIFEGVWKDVKLQHWNNCARKILIWVGLLSPNSNELARILQSVWFESFRLNNILIEYFSCVCRKCLYHNCFIWSPCGQRRGDRQSSALFELAWRYYLVVKFGGMQYINFFSFWGMIFTF